MEETKEKIFLILKKNKKIIVSLLIYLFLICSIFLFWVHVIGFTFNITKIMPKFKDNLYSEATFDEFDIKILNKASKQLDEQISKVSNVIYGDNDHYEKAKRRLLYMNRSNLRAVISSYSETYRNEYKKINKPNYYDYLKNKEFQYDTNERSNNLGAFVYLDNAVDKGIYYEIPAIYYEPVLLLTSEIKKIKNNEVFSISLPLNGTFLDTTSSETYEFNSNIIHINKVDTLGEEVLVSTSSIIDKMNEEHLTSDDIINMSEDEAKEFDLSFSDDNLTYYFTKIDNNKLMYYSEELDESGNINIVENEVIMKQNGKYITLFLGGVRLDKIGMNANLYVLKNARVGIMQSFLFTAAIEEYDLSKVEKNNYNIYFTVEELLDVLKAASDNSNPDGIDPIIFYLSARYFNYLTYDSKGLVTDVIFFVNE